MNNCLPRDSTTDAEGGKTEPATGTQAVRRLIVLMLFTSAALDLTRCGLVMSAARHPGPTAGLVAAGLAGQQCSSASHRPRKRPRPASAALTSSPTQLPLPWEYCWPSPSWRAREGRTAGTRHRKILLAKKR